MVIPEDNDNCQHVQNDPQRCKIKLVVLRSVKATITLCDLMTAILFKLTHSCLNALNLVQ